MPVSINSNLNALRALRRLDEASSTLGRSFERLATGSRINHASDDAAGLSVASSLNLESRVSSQALRNVSDGVSFLNIADGALGELKNILTRLRELSTQSSNGVLSDIQRKSLDKEAEAIQAEYNRVVETAKFNGLSVLSGSVSIQAGIGPGAILTVGVPTANTIVGDGTFQAGRSFSTGIGPLSIVTADLNGDGVPDLVTSDGTGSSASVLLGNGDGTFRARRSFSTGSNPFSVTLADLDADGVLDLVTADSGSGTASVLLGNGDGTFRARMSFNAGSAPSYFVAVADLNGDGVQDLVTADNGGNTASVLLGNANGTFQARISFSVGSAPDSVAAGDLNGDGVPDLVTADFTSNTTSVLLGNGDGTFQARRSFIAGTNARDILLTDLDGDGALDVVTADFGSSTTSVMLGNGNGTFRARTSFAAGTGPRSITAADLNGDGLTDLMTGDSGSTTTTVLIGNGDGTFQAARSYSVGTSPRAVSVGEANGDGVPDLITADNGSNTVSVLLGNGVGGPSKSILTPLTGIQVATRGTAVAAQGRIDSYFDQVNLIAGSIGVGLSRLAVATANLQSNIEATRAAEARITDVDVAEESARLASTGILQRAAAAVLAHAKQEPALALTLLRP